MHSVDVSLTYLLTSAQFGFFACCKYSTVDFGLDFLNVNILLIGPSILRR